MMLKEKKLSVVMAFILGTTMFSSVDKAWSMDDENDLKRVPRASSSTPSSVDEKSLPRDLLLEGTHVRLKKDFVLNTYDSIKFLDKTGVKRAINKDTLEQLLDGNFARVAATVRASLSRPPADEVLKASLKVIRDDSYDDPYDQLILDHLAKNNKLSSPSAKEIEDLKNQFTSLSRAELLDFLTKNLEHVVKDTPKIQASLLAHFPKTSDEKEGERRAAQSLIGTFVPGKEQKSLTFKIENMINDDGQLLEELAERYALLMQIEESLRATTSLPQPSAPDPLLPQLSSSSSMGSVKTSRIEAAVSFNSTFEQVMGNEIPQGWILHDGRKGRVHEERTEKNPLQVQVIGSGKIKIIGDMHNLYYPLPGLKSFGGQKVRFSAKVKSTVPGTRLAYIGKKGEQINSDPHSNREDEEVMNLTFVVDSHPESLNNLYFLGGRAKDGIPPYMEISDINLELMDEND